MSKPPESSIEHVPWVSPWPTSAVFAQLGFGEERLDGGPLLVGEFHLYLGSQPRSPVDPLPASDLVSALTAGASIKCALVAKISLVPILFRILQNYKATVSCRKLIPLTRWFDSLDDIAFGEDMDRPIAAISAARTTRDFTIHDDGTASRLSNVVRTPYELLSNPIPAVSHCAVFELNIHVHEYATGRTLQLCSDLIVCAHQ
jgi:hypothetical protein